MTGDDDFTQRFRLRLAYGGLAAGLWIVGVSLFFLIVAHSLGLLVILVLGLLFLVYSVVRLRTLRRTAFS